MLATWQASHSGRRPSIGTCVALAARRPPKRGRRGERRQGDTCHVASIASPAPLVARRGTAGPGAGGQEVRYLPIGK